MDVYHIYHTACGNIKGVSLMGIPTTLAGSAGFVIACIFLIGVASTDVFPDQSARIIHSQTDFTNALNQSVAPMDTTTDIGFFGSLLGAVGLNGIYDFIRNFLSLLVSFIVMSMQYVLLFVGISSILPTEFYLFFALIISGSIISIIKLIFIAGE
jgi:hypothetical protein